MNIHESTSSSGGSNLGPSDRIGVARGLLDAYERRTGVTGDGEAVVSKHRYLWTDALAVSAELRLARAIPEADRETRAVRLADLVHHVLGRHRDDDPRNGRLPGADASHPTAGGLRIGKPLPERLPGEAFDERLEWERDGQYFHYLTRWMHALVDLGEATSDRSRLDQAVELAEAAGDAFIERDEGGLPTGISWKRSIDLRRSLVAGGGGLDPLDGCATVARIVCAGRRAGSDVGDRLLRRLEDLASLSLASNSWATADPLGIGGLIGAATTLLDVAVAAERVLDLEIVGELVERSLLDARAGLVAYERARRRALGHRPGLGFRELGLSSGLHAAADVGRRIAAASQPIPDLLSRKSVLRLLEDLGRFAPSARAIERHWIDAAYRGFSEWREHLDINEVSLAWSLVQDLT